MKFCVTLRDEECFLLRMVDSFLKKVGDFVACHHLITGNERVIVGLSGGADSVALLRVLHVLGADCLAAHCNFHLRGEESMRDESFCRKLCEDLGIELVTTDFDVDSRCCSTGESVEMACRGLRYEWWDSMIREGKGRVVAVGHHREDNTETFFLNLLRGSGIAGLKAMLPKTMNVIRPLLECRKDEILDYLASLGQDYVTDSSNLSDDYKRNRLRNTVLPEIERNFPGAMDAIARSIDYLRDNYSLYNDYSDYLRRKYVGSDGSIDLGRIVTSEKNARMVLFEILSKFGINMTQVDNILASMDDEGSCRVSGRMFRSPVVSYLLDRGRLVPYDADADSDAASEIAGLDTPPLHCRRMSRGEFDRLREEGELAEGALYLDSRVEYDEPTFELRPWRKGDRMRPFGMKGSRLISDMLTDAKYSFAQKRQLRLLTRNSEILWAIGLRTSALFTVGQGCSEVLEVKYESL